MPGGLCQPGAGIPAWGGHASLAYGFSQLRGSRQAMSLAHKGAFSCARLGVRGRIWGAASAQKVPGPCVGLCWGRGHPSLPPALAGEGLGVPLTCCPQEELGGLLGGAGREQPHLLQGAQGAGTHCLGEWGAWRWAGTVGECWSMGRRGGGSGGRGLWRNTRCCGDARGTGHP